MSQHQHEPRFTRLADYLHESADELTDEWLDRLDTRLGVRPRRLLPSAQLRNHIPDVIRGAARFLDIPAQQAPNEIVDILRTLAQLRREQGYDVQELLVEVDMLSDLVFERVARWAEETGALEGVTAMRAAARLSSVLRSVASVAVGTYREEELRQRHELSKELGEFADMLAHEMRNPLGSAAISAELLVQETIASDPEQRQKHADRIQERLRRLGHLVDDIRILAVTEEARAEPEWVSASDTASLVVRELQPAAERQGVEIHVEEPDQDFEVDAVRVEIALMNLVTNAIKFSDPAKAHRWVKITFGEATSNGLEGGRRITVADNGRGIEPDSQNKVFQRFYRSYPEVEGTGLGLSITRRVVEQRGGRLWFESEVGKGTCFHMEIPQRLDAGDGERGEVRPEQSRPGAGGNPSDAPVTNASARAPERSRR